MEQLPLIIDLHRRNPRQGPGGTAETLLALELAALGSDSTVSVADLGAGTGAGTLLLARHLNAHVTAVDFLPEFVEEMTTRVSDAGIQNDVEYLVASIDKLPFQTEQFDLIWSEGAVYNVGFARGVEYWRQFLKPGGVLAVSEITWLTNSRPHEIENFWRNAYPEIGTAAEKTAVLEACGYSPCGYFTLGEHCWQDNYYTPLSDAKSAFLGRHNHSEAAREIVAETEEEQALYEKYKHYYSYGFYIARRAG